MKLHPVSRRILVKPFKAKEKTSGGIYLPDTAKEKLHEGEVVAVAEDATDEVTTGDYVIYKEFTGTKIKLEGEDYILFIGGDLLAKYVTLDKIPE